MSARRIIDLTYDLNPQTPVYPDYPRVEITILETLQDVIPGRRSLNSSRIAIGMHCGTHMDAPFHFIGNGRTIDQVPLECLVGPAVLVDLREAAKDGVIEKKDLADFYPKLNRTRKIVINTGWSHVWGKPNYFTDHPVLTAEAAQFLVDSGVQLVGLDTPSVDRPPFPAHIPLLGSDIVIVENLTNLDDIAGEVFELIVLPLKITSREGSPVRAIALT
jgi:kynurenine formamidase